MLILVNFPYQAHYKHKDKFMEDFGGRYLDDDTKFMCVIECNIRKFMKVMQKITDYFSSHDIDYWEIMDVSIWADYSLTPVRINEYKINPVLDTKKISTYMDNLRFKSVVHYNSYGEKI